MDHPVDYSPPTQLSRLFTVQGILDKTRGASHCSERQRTGADLLTCGQHTRGRDWSNPSNRHMEPDQEHKRWGRSTACKIVARSAHYGYTSSSRCCHRNHFLLKRPPDNLDNAPPRSLAPTRSILGRLDGLAGAALPLEPSFETSVVDTESAHPSPSFISEISPSLPRLRSGDVVAC